MGTTREKWSSSGRRKILFRGGGGEKATKQAKMHMSGAEAEWATSGTTANALAKCHKGEARWGFLQFDKVDHRVKKNKKTLKHPKTNQAQPVMDPVHE